MTTLLAETDRDVLAHIATGKVANALAFRCPDGHLMAPDRIVVTYLGNYAEITLRGLQVDQCTGQPAWPGNRRRAARLRPDQAPDWAAEFVAAHRPTVTTNALENL